MIKKAEKNELKDLIPLYKEVFPVHNIFNKSDNEILEYLENVKGDFLIAEEDGKVVGGLLIVIEEETPKHKRARFKHVAVSKNYQRKGIGSQLIKKAEEIIGKGKIEIHVAETEQGIVEFYKKNGYKVEGELESHYRPNEKCYIMGKVLK